MYKSLYFLLALSPSIDSAVFEEVTLDISDFVSCDLRFLSVIISHYDLILMFAMPFLPFNRKL